MTKPDEQHPVSIMRDGSRHLQKQAQSTSQHVNLYAQHARKAGSDIANLDIEGIFKQLHQLVEIVGGKSKHRRPIPARDNVPSNVQDNAQPALPMAAE